MIVGGLVVFVLSVRVCSPLIIESCHYERIADFVSDGLCHAAGHVMQIYPNIFGYRCRVETHEYQYRPGIGNPY
jgi:hypothetical protein